MNANPGTDFFISCIMCRMLQGVGYVGIQVSSFTIVANDYSAHISTFAGLLEMASGLGFVIGPTVGGIIYDNIGFKAPFLLVSALLVLMFIISYFIIHPDNSYHNDKSVKKVENSSGLSVKTIIKMPETFIPLGCCVAIWINFTYFDVALAPRMTETFHTSSTVGGMSFLGPSICYSILAPLTGYYVDKKVSFKLSYSAFESRWGYTVALNRNS
ncbi:Uncharacterised protein g184 [Pycnogonum litorale]